MPDTPKNPADDETMKVAWHSWWATKRWNGSFLTKEIFDAGWRAAMAEVKREPTQKDLICRLHRALVLTKADAERVGGPYGSQANCVNAIRDAERWLART